jgi:hypothetical protein
VRARGEEIRDASRLAAGKTVRGDAGGLVDDQQRFVFITDGDRQIRTRRRRGRQPMRGALKRELIAGRESVALLARASAHPERALVDRPLRLAQRQMREAAAHEGVEPDRLNLSRYLPRSLLAHRLSASAL